MANIDLSRFIDTHQDMAYQALSEIRNGYKISHWMWYIFPQIHGLGYSYYASLYAIKDLDEARAFVNHPYLGRNLIEISEALLALESNDASYIMGYPDDLKLRSSMTLFTQVSDNPVFQKVLDKFFGGKPDEKTLEILEMDKEKTQEKIDCENCENKKD